MLQIDTPTFEHHRAGDSLGIGQASPRLSWRFLSSVSDWTQKSYEIQIHFSSGTISTGRNENPKSYKVKSECSVLVPWPAEPLRSRERACVRVKAFGANDGGNTDWSAWAVVETGLLETKDWDASFIEAPRTLSFGGSLRPALFRKEFKLKYKVRSARLYATAHGVYTIFINGQKVGDHILAPGWTSYKHQLNYQTYDVTSLLTKGSNVIGAEVAEGWWAGRLGWEEQWRCIYGDTLGLLAQLEIETQHGGKITVSSDDSWTTSFGSLLGSEIYNGETYDANKELDGWSTSEYSDKSWKSVTTAGLGNARLQAPEGPPVRETETVSVKSITRSASGAVLLDFGQNLVGYLKVKISGPKNHTVTFHHAEVLVDNELGTIPLRSAKAIDTLTLSDKSMIWSPSYTFHGFRYVQVDNWPSHHGEPDIKDIAAVVIHTDLERTGEFECSDEMVNKLHSNIRWGMRGNFVSIPTDCPQRDERLGWTGDLQVFCPTASFLYSTTGMLSSWLKDLTVEQQDLGGIVANVVPNPLPPQHNRPQAAWCDAAIMTPWDLYNAYGDIEILRAQYESMKDWLVRGLRRQQNGLWDESERQLGDWLDPAAPAEEPEKGTTPPYLVANAYLVHVTNLIARVAALLRMQNEYTHWSVEAARIKLLFQNEYITPNGRLAPDSQTSIALAVAFELFDSQQQIDYAGERLEGIVRENGFRIGTGFCGTPVILPVLSKVGRVDIAYQMLAQRECPSWLYPITMGATTQWERWDSMLPDGRLNSSGMTSFNHYALGSVAHFLHTTVGGIAPLTPGYKTILFSPSPPSDNSISWAKTSFLSVYGKISCEWKTSESEGIRRFEMTVKAPMNTRAVVRLPEFIGMSCVECNRGDAREMRVGSGMHVFSTSYVLNTEAQDK